MARNAFRALVLVLLALPGAVLAVFCIVLAFVPIRASRDAIANLRIRFGASSIRARTLLARMYFHYVCYFAETSILWPLGLIETRGEPALASFLGDLAVRRGLNETRGVLFLGAHFGNIEALGAVLRVGLAAAGLKPYYVLARPSKFKFVEAMFKWMREDRGFLVLRTGGPDFKEALARIARSGFALVLLADQKPRRGGLFLPFFGAEAAFPDKGVALGLETRMAIVHVAHRRIGLGRFELVYEEGASNATSPREALAAYVCWLEAVIRTAPEHWCWDYRKWSRQKEAALAE